MFCLYKIVWYFFIIVVLSWHILFLFKTWLMNLLLISVTKKERGTFLRLEKIDTFVWQLHLWILPLFYFCWLSSERSEETLFLLWLLLNIFFWILIKRPYTVNTLYWFSNTLYGWFFAIFKAVRSAYCWIIHENEFMLEFNLTKVFYPLFLNWLRFDISLSYFLFRMIKLWLEVYGRCRIS